MKHRLRATYRYKRYRSPEETYARNVARRLAREAELEKMRVENPLAYELEMAMQRLTNSLAQQLYGDFPTGGTGKIVGLKYQGDE